MTEEKKRTIADAAEMIVGGYAFLRQEENITIVNLNQKDEHAMVITRDGKMLESSMDPIEQVIALKNGKKMLNLWRMKLPKYFLIKLQDIIFIIQSTVLLSACMLMLVTKNLPKVAQQNFLS